MINISPSLLQSITSQFQLVANGRHPEQYVLVRNRFFGNTSNPGLLDVEWARLPNVISIETDETVETPAKSFTIVLNNKDGRFSPDYYAGKWPQRYLFRGVPESPWAGQLFPNTEIQIHLGYGKEVIPKLYGLIDEVTINAENQTVTITGRSMYKKVLTTTIKPEKNQKYFLTDKNLNIGEAVKKLVEGAGVSCTAPFVTVPGSNPPESYTIGVERGERFQTFDDAVRDIVDSLFFTMIEDAQGKVFLKPIPRYSQTDEPKMVIDDFLHLKELEYTLSDNDLYGTVIIKCGDKADVFYSGFITNHILRGQRREIEYEVPWANTRFKRKLAAQAYFTQMLHRWRKMSIAIPANPALELWDVVSVRERISTVTWRYHIRAIRTTWTQDSFFQILELSSNYGYKPEPPPPPPKSDLPPVTVNQARVVINIWDFSREDKDIINVYLNGSKILNNFEIKNAKKQIVLDLEYGANVVDFEGVSAGTLRTLSAKMEVVDVSGNIIIPSSSIPDLEMQRTNVTEPSGYYTKRPKVRWVIYRN
jgi:copper chaperone CopZ